MNNVVAVSVPCHAEMSCSLSAHRPTLFFATLNEK